MGNPVQQAAQQVERIVVEDAEEMVLMLLRRCRNKDLRIAQLEKALFELTDALKRERAKAGTPPGPSAGDGQDKPPAPPAADNTGHE